MRIVSQDGRWDIPYEQVAIQRCGTNIYFYNSNLDYDAEKIAEYSTEEKANTAMEMLREAYMGIIVLENMDNMEKVLNESGALKLPAINYTTDSKVSNIKYINEAVFQFPKDEDVTV